MSKNFKFSGFDIFLHKIAEICRIFSNLPTFLKFFKYFCFDIFLCKIAEICRPMGRFCHICLFLVLGLLTHGFSCDERLIIYLCLGWCSAFGFVGEQLPMLPGYIYIPIYPYYIYTIIWSQGQKGQIIWFQGQILISWPNYVYH